MNMTRPLCINPKSERLKGLKNDVYVMLDTYAQDQADMYDWYYPEELNDVPNDYAERSIFYTGSLGICPYNSQHKSKYRITPGSHVKVDAYGKSIAWVATRIDPNSTVHSGTRWFTHRYPLMEMSYIPADFVYDYVKMRHSGMISAGQNTVAMRQPVTLKGQVGEVGIGFLLDKVTSGDSYIPIIQGDNYTREIEVLDLGAQNFLDPLTGFIDSTDGWACRMIGTDSVSNQKESGISIEEVTAGDRRVKARRNNGLKLRQDWCDKVKDALDIEIEVYLNDEYDPGTYGDALADGVDSDIRDDTLSASDAGTS